MAIITEPTLYVLGAGVSRCADVPLLNDFLVRSKYLLNSSNDLVWRESFKNVFGFIDKLSRSQVSLSIDTDNLEHIFSLIEMSKEAGYEGGDALNVDLSKLIFETIDKSWNIRYRSKSYQPNHYFSKFVKDLQSNKEKRRGILQNSGRLFSSDYILTFNYDLILDYALRFEQANFTYGYNPLTADGFSLFKIHGSMNWAKCQDCKHEEELPLTFEAKGYHRPFLEEDAMFSSNIATDVLLKSKCSGCGKEGTLFPIFIPPTWSKRLEEDRIKKTWKELVSVIKNVQQIVVIGYSFPKTDTFFQYLLSLGLIDVNQLARIVIINPDIEAMENRCRDIFLGLSHRKRLVLLKASFEDFLDKSGMEQLIRLETSDLIKTLRSESLSFKVL